MARGYNHAPRAEKSPETNLDWPALMEEAINSPGQLGNTYNRLHNYSFLNQILLLSQGVREPVASYKRWQSIGRQVMKGSKGYQIIRPISVKLRDQLDDDGQPLTITKFKPVNGAFAVSQTEGEALPEYEPQEWSKERALGALAIRHVTYESLDGNSQGYSVDRDIAINPVARYPFKTLWHEMGHVVLGHTTADQLAEYQAHRGIKEFQAESVAYLGLHELDADDAFNAAESRGYIQNWLRGEKPSDEAIRGVFKATDTILKAGRVAVEAGS